MQQLRESRSICGGVHTPDSPVHVLHAPNAPHPHIPSQVRDLVWVPHIPQPCISVSIAPGEQTPLSPPHEP